MTGMGNPREAISSAVGSSEGIETALLQTRPLAFEFLQSMDGLLQDSNQLVHIRSIFDRPGDSLRDECVGLQGSDSVSSRHPPRKTLPDPIQLKIQFPSSNAVDSQQAGADVVTDRKKLHVLFIDERTREIYSTHDRGGWQPSVQRVRDVNAAWVLVSVVQAGVISFAGLLMSALSA